MKVAISLLALFILSNLSIAQWSNDSTVNNPICTRLTNQFQTQIISDGLDGAIITWLDTVGSTGSNIYAQKINSDGVTEWATNGVQISVGGTVSIFGNLNFRVISDGIGGAIIAWSDGRNAIYEMDIYAQRINSDGVPQWAPEGVAICTAQGYQTSPALISDNNGGAIITWQDQRFFEFTDIYAQKLNSNGMVQWTVNGVAICTAYNAQFQPELLSDGTGGAIIAWADYRTVSYSNVYVQRVNSNGAVQWVADGIAICPTSYLQFFQRLISDGSGGAIICWSDYRSGTPNIYVQRINSSGINQWISSGVVITTNYAGGIPTITSDDNSGAIITWEEARSYYINIYAQRINPDGLVLWATNGIPISTELSYSKGQHNVTRDGFGGAIITWLSFDEMRNIYAQRINSSGIIQWSPGGNSICEANNEQNNPQMISDGIGGAIISWEDYRSGMNWDIFASRVDQTGTLYGYSCQILPSSNPNPSNNATDMPLSGNTLTWSNGSGVNEIEVWFGELGNLVQVYNGTPITSYPLNPFEPLQYGTTYGWQVIGKDSTCSTNGPVWTFTTEQDPNLVTDTIKIYPQNSNYWTGTCNASTKTDVSEVRGRNTEDGWFVFDVSSLPVSSTVSSIKFYGYVNSTNYPYWSLTPLGTIDPRTASASEIKTYVESHSAQGVAYLFANESSSFTTGWHNWTLEPQAKLDLQNAISQGWFACGMDSRNNSASYWLEFDGWLQANKPYLEIIYHYIRPATQLNVNIANGWNLVSIPGLHPDNQNVITWWPGQDPAGRVYKFNWGYQPVTVAAPTEGYWMKHLGAQIYNTGDEWPVSGIFVVPHLPINGAVGWNLIGGYELSVATSNVVTNPPGLQSGPIYTYSGGYQVATTFIPGYGYWLRLTAAGQIIIPETLAKENEFVNYFPEEWGKIILTDAEGMNYTLYAVKGEVDLTQYELPPPPPEGMFDIRYRSGRIAEYLSNDNQSIEMSGIKYPIRVKVENIKIKLQDETTNIIYTVIEPDQEITIDNLSKNKILIVSAEFTTPNEYALEQNYPNPFNPVTTVKFSIPEATNVVLTIYNVLGEKISTLVDSKLEAGKYNYQWNASNVATGIYIYEIRTEKFVAVKKMILMK